MDLLFALFCLVCFWACYIVPTLIAFQRRHPNRTSIMVVNIGLGWTLIGWVLCLAWAYSNPPIPNRA